MKNKLTLALVAVLTSTAFAALETPLPEFKTDKQLAEWRAEKAVASTNRSHVTEESAFYTGKPYIESSSGYAFKYRSYNPELARWTSEDPSGFPDGANDHSYINNKPTSKIDFEGLLSQDISISFSWKTSLGFTNFATWHGIYVWSQIENAENVKVNKIGFTGDLPSSGTYYDQPLGGFFDPIIVDRSGYNTKFENGAQWKQWNLDIGVEIWHRDQTINSTITKMAESARFIITGHWYE